VLGTQAVDVFWRVGSQKVGWRYVQYHEPGYLSQYSVWLRTGRPGGGGSIPGRGKRIFF
jgi:hypothetical protein